MPSRPVSRPTKKSPETTRSRAKGFDSSYFFSSATVASPAPDEGVLFVMPQRPKRTVHRQLYRDKQDEKTCCLIGGCYPPSSE